MLRPGPEGDALDVPGLEIAFPDQVQHGGDARMPEAPGGEQLHRHARVEQRVGRAEVEPLRVEAAAEHPEKAPLRLQGVAPRGIAPAGEIHRQDSALGGPAGVERLRHRAEAEADSGGEAGRYAERHPQLLRPSPLSFAAAAAAPRAPMVAVEWKPSR